MSALSMLALLLVAQAATGSAPWHDIGGDGLINVVAAARNGAWVLYCQQTGDPERDGPPRLHLAGADGRELPLNADAILALDPTDRRAVILRGQEMWLVVLRSAHATRLGPFRGTPGTADEVTPYLTFDASGDRLLYPSDWGHVRVRDFRTGISVTLRGMGILDPGGAWLWRSPEGLFTERPSLHTNRCTPVEADSARWLPSLASGRLVEVAAPHRKFDIGGVLAVVGDAFVVRLEDGSLSWRSNGVEVTIAPASCAGHLEHVDVASDQVIVSCGRGAATSLIAARGGQTVAIDGTWLATEGRDRTRHGRWLTFPSGGDALDTVTLARLELTTGQWLAHAVGRRVLIQQSHRLSVWRDLDSGATVTAPDPSSGPTTTPAGPWIAVRIGQDRGLLWNVETGTHRSLAGVPLAVTETGRVLVGRGETPGIISFRVFGPLRAVDGGSAAP